MDNFRNAVRRFVFNYPRPAGVFYVLVGAMLWYATIIQPIQQANVGVREVKIYVGVGTFSSVMTLLGLCLMVFGERCARLLWPSANESKRSAYLMLIGALLGIVSITVYSMLESYVKSKGYIFKY
jgi:hypothetical protein